MSGTTTKTDETLGVAVARSGDEVAFEPPIPDDPAVAFVDRFVGARDKAGPTERLEEVRGRSRDFHDEMMDETPVVFYGSFDLVRVPYPRKYGFRDACLAPTPLVHILNRLFVVQYRAGKAVKTLLFSPTDPQLSKATPFFARMARSFGPLQEFGTKLIGPVIATVEDAVAGLGIDPADVDYISYDHLHTQDIRKWVGTDGSAGYFPNAKLLVTAQEWASANSLLPYQRVWYCPDGVKGVAPDRIVRFDQSIRLGEGVVLMRTPGHTEGNHSLVVRTDEGVMVSSENGIGPDAYAPTESKIPGIADFARRTGAEVIMNGNTLEGSVDQYISMVQEREVAGPSRRNPAFPNIVASSELASYWAFPGVKPTFGFGELRFGAPVTAR